VVVHTHLGLELGYMNPLLQKIIVFQCFSQLVLIQLLLLLFLFEQGFQFVNFFCFFAPMESVLGILLLLDWLVVILYLSVFWFRLLEFPNFDSTNYLFNQILCLNFFYLSLLHFEICEMIDFGFFKIAILWINLNICHVSRFIFIWDPIKLFMATHFIHYISFTSKDFDFVSATD
jgi:hypothetical protein